MTRFKRELNKEESKMNKDKLLDKTFACIAASAIGDSMGAPVDSVMEEKERAVLEVKSIKRGN